MAIPVKTQQVTPQTVEDVLIKGDLSALTPDQRKEYYLNVCRSLNLNPLTQPFTYLTLNGKLTLYPNRTCSDQLAKNNGISIEIVSQDHQDGILVVHVRGKDKDGRQDENIGAINFPDMLKGEARANALMKGITKAKRRLILGMAGLGWPDETEIEDIPSRAKEPAVDPETGEVLDAKSTTNRIPFDPKTGEIIETEDPAPAKAAEPPAGHSLEGSPHRIILQDPVDWIWFGQLMIGYSRTDHWAEWHGTNTANIARMENEAPKVYARMMSAIKKSLEAR